MIFLKGSNMTTDQTRITTQVTATAKARRPVLALAVVAASAWLAACSSVKIDDPKPAPITTAPIPSSSSNASSSSTAPTSTVAPVVADADAGSAAAFAALPKVIYFDYDSYVVKEEFRPTIEGYAKSLNAAKSRRLTVEGHTDDRGGREYNLALGQKRAEAAVKSLTLLGVSADQLEAVSLGKERPAVEGSTEQAYAKNRRAEFKGK